MNVVLLWATLILWAGVVVVAILENKSVSGRGFMLLYLLLPFVGYFGFVIYTTYNSYVKSKIEDGCWVYLRGAVYCDGCKIKHKIGGIDVTQVWDGGSSDQGWEAHVWPTLENSDVLHEGLVFDLTLHNKNVIGMKFERFEVP